MEKEEYLGLYRHSLSHILAKAVIEIFGKDNFFLEIQKKTHMENVTSIRTKSTDSAIFLSNPFSILHFIGVTPYSTKRHVYMKIIIIGAGELGRLLAERLSSARNDVTIIDVSKETLTLSVIGDEKKTNAVQELLEGFGIVELVRTGMIALERGKYTINEDTKEKGEFNYGKDVL